MEKVQPERPASQLFHKRSCRKDCPERPGNDPMARLNHALDTLPVPWGVNESIIESILYQWEQYGKQHLPQHWLIAARIFEMAILCAGHYVDNCEYTAAGDLLFNPRKILIYQKGCSHPIKKHRHGCLSDQLHGHRVADQAFPIWFRDNATLRLVRPAVIPFLQTSMEQSGRVADAYLRTVRQRMERAADTMAFLNSWSVSRQADRQDRIESASPETRRFIADHLCAFDDEVFKSLGEEIHRSCNDPGYQSRFVTPPAHTHACTMRLRTITPLFQRPQNRRRRPCPY
ncbi:MAG: hypothetical protein PVH87_26315 [Desulfobacteraceae bacterium]|jgi:hypothetical protein